MIDYILAGQIDPERLATWKRSAEWYVPTENSYLTTRKKKRQIKPLNSKIRRHMMTQYQDEEQHTMDNLFLEENLNDLDKYMSIEYNLYTIINDLSNTCKEMDKVQSETETHFVMPMELLHEISRLVHTTIDKHTVVKK